MKLNFWQWLAVVLLIIGIAVWIYEKEHAASTTPTTHSVTAPTTQTVPSTQGVVAR